MAAARWEGGGNDVGRWWQPRKLQETRRKMAASRWEGGSSLVGRWQQLVVMVAAVWSEDGSSQVESRHHPGGKWQQPGGKVAAVS